MEILDKISVKYIRGSFIIEARLDRENPIVSHFEAIDIVCKKGSEEKIVASLDPWRDVYFRHKNSSEAKYRIESRIAGKTRLRLSEWL